MIRSEILSSDRDNSILIRGYFQNVIFKAETDSRNQEGECHVSQQIIDEWTWTGLRKREVLTAYKAHFVHCD